MQLAEVGSLLKDARVKKNCDINDASKALKIRSKYLEAIERGDIDKVVSEIYLMGYVKSYAHWLGLDSSQLLNDIKAGNDNYSPSSPTLAATSTPTAQQPYIASQKKIVRPSRLIVLLSVLVGSAVYAIWYVSADYNDNAAIKNTDNLIIDSPQQADIDETGEPTLQGSFVFYAHDDVQLTILDKKGDVALTHAMKSGEAYFMSDRKGVAVKADKPESIEVFTDDPNSVFLGALKPITTVDQLRQMAKERNAEE